MAESVPARLSSGAEVLVEGLLRHGVDRVFCVPGESYLAVLDALRDSTIETVVARHEGAAAMMAEADAKQTGRPGVCFVTRGPGATNASSGIHVAQQDSTPLVLFVGQVQRAMRGRDAFQEIDCAALFGGMAKFVAEAESAGELARLVPDAFAAALRGRPGPAVISLPEDVLSEAADRAAEAPRAIERPVPDEAALSALRERLQAAERPIVLAGGSCWTAAGRERLHAFAERWQVPVACVFRRQHLFDHLHPHYAGDVGLGINPRLRAAIAASDLVVLLGTRLSEAPSQGYTLISGQPLVHVHVDAAELGRVYPADVALHAAAEDVLGALGDPPVPIARADWVGANHTAYLAWSEQAPANPGRLQMGQVMTWLRAHLPEDAIVTNGAGNYAAWVHRFFRFRRFCSQLAPTSGSMGYGLPAAIAAKLRNPDRTVVCFAGDGCFQMTGQELATARQFGANVIVLVVDNGMYGTIRMHQERRFPGREHATNIVGPDFAALARAYACHGECVDETAAFATAFERARASGLPAVLHLRLDPRAIAPGVTLEERAHVG